MNWFWPIATLLLILGVAGLFVGNGAQINFTDLETECRYDRDSEVSVGLENRRLDFEGYYPVENPETDLSYSYSVRDNTVTLDIQASNQQNITDFYNNCWASAIYDARSAELEEGRYLVNVEHNGERAYRSVIEVE